VGIAPADVWDQYDGPTIARMYVAGQLPVMPAAALLHVHVLEWDEGRIQVSVPTSEWLCGERREVAPGILTLLANMTLGGTTAVKLGQRRLQVGIVDDTVSIYREVASDGRDLLATGKITHRPGDFVVSSMEIIDADGNLVAVGHRTSVFLEARALRPPKLQRTLLTVLFTDLVDSTRTANDLGDERWSELLGRHHRMTRRELELHDGAEVKTTGDGFLATFSSPTRAVQCARAIRAGVRSLGLDLRAGIHTGECEVGGGDVAGLAVHVASRVQAAAKPGEILISSTVRDLTTGSGLHLIERGGQELKGLDGKWALFALDE
jgi:class 3 adenylate cyclase